MSNYMDEAERLLAAAEAKIPDFDSQTVPSAAAEAQFNALVSLAEANLRAETIRKIQNP